MQSKASTVKQYLAELPPDRRAAISAVRDVVLKNLDKDYEEGMTYGMIGWYVPHGVYPAGYHCDPKMPLPFANLASQKNHMSLHLLCMYGNDAQEEWLRAQFAAAGKKLDMGKGCIRFKKLEDLPLDVIGEAIRRVPARQHIEIYEAALASMGKKHPGAAKSGASAQRESKKAAPKRPAKPAATKKTSSARKKTASKR